MRLNKAENEVTAAFARNPEYHMFFQMISAKHHFRFAYGKDAHKGKWVFKNICKYHKGKIIPAEKTFTADKIYQFRKMADVGQDFAPAKIMNTPEFRGTMGNKFTQHEYLVEFFPTTKLFHTIPEMNTYIRKSKKAYVIVKPSSWQKGDGVLFWKKTKPVTAKDIDMDKLKKTGYLVQDFMDTSCGIKWVVTWTHDVKIINIGKKMFFNLRTPYRDGVICTFDSDYTEVPLRKIPKSIITFRNAVHKKIMKKYPKQIYSMDIGMTKEWPQLIELNTHTAFPYIHFDYAMDFIQSFIKHLEKY